MVPLQNLLETPVPKVIYDKILSDKTYYGVIWTGRACTHSATTAHPCIIKMVILTSGIHYDRKDEAYVRGTEVHRRCRVFDADEDKPYYHKLFDKRRSMTPEQFAREGRATHHLAKLGLSPEVYGCWIERYPNGIHYGFLAMERMTCSLKSILLEREIAEKEMGLIEKLIQNLHKTGFVHQDLKPSNLGVYLNRQDEIVECRVFDCQKVKKKVETSESNFSRLRKKDWSVFEEHYKRNRRERGTKTKDHLAKCGLGPRKDTDARPRIDDPPLDIRYELDDADDRKFPLRLTEATSRP